MLVRNVLLACFIIFFSTNCFGQWSGAYGNEWIDYSKPYLRFGVTEKGIQRIDVQLLPKEYQNVNPDMYQLWRRGKEIAIIKATSREILFYGEPNDGASDSLLFRPMSARMNPYVSFYSNESSYFLTLNNKSRRAVIIDGSSVSGEPLKYHMQKDLKKFTNQFAFTVQGVESSLNQSYFVSANSWTGPTVAGPKARLTSSVKDTVSYNDFQVSNWVQTATEKPSIELMVNGLNEGFHNLQMYLGKSRTSSDLRKIATLPFTGWASKKASSTLSAGDFADDGKGVLKIYSTSTEYTDWHGLSYFVLTYPQLMDMSKVSGDLKMSFFNFNGSDQKVTRISIDNPPSSIQLFDITDSSDPKRIIGKSGSATNYGAMISRLSNDSQVLLALDSTAVRSIPAARIYNVNFGAIYENVNGGKVGSGLDPKSYDYLIVTHDGLAGEAGNYGKYRASIEGGQYNVLVMDVRNLYNQFNYGEPSPVAIRRFTDYMLQSGVRDKHNLLLIGPSISYQKDIIKELPGEVPTFGDPGSDVLLVAGLKGNNIDIPAIPVGRINAYQPSQVVDYLGKVKLYEQQTDVGWRKNILHLNGGHSPAEITQLQNILEDLKPLVENGEVGGKVQAFVKQSPADTEPVDISSEVNEGIGMLTFFGHGSTNITDLDMGNISDATRGYKNVNKYSLMYFNGCGVGNIFLRRTPPTLADDWVLTGEKGAIAVIANSYLSYVSSSQKYLDQMYETLYAEPERRTIGKVLVATAGKILSSNSNEYDITNVHQLNLMGDPALVLIRMEHPDYALDLDEGIILASESPGKTIGASKNLRIGILLSNFGKNNKDEMIPVQVTIQYQGGTSSTINQQFKAVSYMDTLFLNIANKSEIIQRISVNIDPLNKITELSKSNNLSELIVDWDVAKKQYIYPTETIKDNIVPQLNVAFNNRMLTNGEIISPKPIVTFTVSDDRLLKADSTLLNVYFKRCPESDCVFEKLSFAKENFSIKSISERSVKFDLMSKWDKGSYELLVYAQDVSGNSTKSGYQINFQVGEIEEKLKVTVSPNPSSDYIKFVSSFGGIRSLNSIRYSILDGSGRLILNEQVEISGPDKTSNYQDWYWKPANSSVSSGLYLYKITYDWSDTTQETVSGKVVVVR